MAPSKLVTVEADAKTPLTTALDKVAGFLESKGFKEQAAVIDAVQNDLDSMFSAKKTAATPQEVAKNYLVDATRYVLDAVNTVEHINEPRLEQQLKALQKKLHTFLNNFKKGTAATSKEAATVSEDILESLKGLSTSILGFIETISSQGNAGDAPLIKEAKALNAELTRIFREIKEPPPKAIASDVSSLEEDADLVSASEKPGEGDIISVRITSSIRLVGLADDSGFRRPSFVKQATEMLWKISVQKLVDSGKGYHQDGSPAYGRAIDLYKASL